MTINDFRILAPQMKTQTLKRFGALLYVRQELDIDIVLYQLEGFYVEVFFDSYKSAEAKFRCFESTGELEPYLRTIDISPLVQLLR